MILGRLYEEDAISIILCVSTCMCVKITISVVLGHVYTETIWAKNGNFPLWMHLSYENDKNDNRKRIETKTLSKVETLKTFSSLPFPFPRVNRENTTKTHTCYSK